MGNSNDIVATVLSGKIGQISLSKAPKGIVITPSNFDMKAITEHRIKIGGDWYSSLDNGRHRCYFVEIPQESNNLSLASEVILVDASNDDNEEFSFKPVPF